MTYTKKMPTRMKKRATKSKVSKPVKNYIKKALTKDKEVYIIDDYAVESAIGTLSLWYADSYMSWSNALNMIQGQDKTVESSGFKIKYHLMNNSTTTALGVRMLVIENLTSATDYRTGTALFERWAYNSSGSLNANYSSTTGDLVSRINRDKYRVLADKRMKLGLLPSTNGAGAFFNFVEGSLWVPYRRKIQYDQVGSGEFPNRGHVAVIFLPIEAPNDVTTGQTLEVTCNVAWYLRK